MWVFGDSFDLYAAAADAYAGYWDGFAGSAPQLIAGRFSGGQGISWSALSTFSKSSGSNDQIHHFTFAYNQGTITGAGGGSPAGIVTLIDGTTSQCTLGFRADGSMILVSGVPNGTVLDSWPGALPSPNQWIAFEVESRHQQHQRWMDDPSFWQHVERL
jgi:hypothetical protein